MKNDGGPAFPRPFSEDKFNEDQLPSQRGMSLRDWFAGMALQGYLTNGYGRDLAISCALEIAKLMIEEKNRQQ